jgi:hypothetical protein
MPHNGKAGGSYKTKPGHPTANPDGGHRRGHLMPISQEEQFIKRGMQVQRDLRMLQGVLTPDELMVQVPLERIVLDIGSSLMVLEWLVKAFQKKTGNLSLPIDFVAFKNTYEKVKESLEQKEVEMPHQGKKPYKSGAIKTPKKEK